jgi:RNA polymerase sigma-70 factor (ECF subfamily)
MARDGEQTDAQLIAASGKSPRSFMPLVERHHRVLFGYLARRVGRDIAEDIVAETFARAYATRARYDDRWPDARPWLFGIALNLMRHHLRSEARQLRAYARSGIDPVLHDDDETIARVDAQEMGPQVAAALAEMSAGDRDALRLFAWADMSYEDISNTLDIPVGTVRSRLNRARRQMQQALESETDESVSGGTL